VTERTIVVSGQRCVWVTSTVDGADHAMTDEAMAAGLAAKCGVFLALCSADVVAAPMVAPPGQRCVRCQAFVHPQPAPCVAPARRRWVGWLSGWRRG
jgi:hypothetical protein